MTEVCGSTPQSNTFLFQNSPRDFFLCEMETKENVMLGDNQSDAKETKQTLR